jgi:hypothetical protein
MVDRNEQRYMLTFTTKKLPSTSQAARMKSMVHENLLSARMIMISRTFPPIPIDHLTPTLQTIFNIHLSSISTKEKKQPCLHLYIVYGV